MYAISHVLPTVEQAAASIPVRTTNTDTKLANQRDPQCAQCGWRGSHAPDCALIK
ncbi:hypothetical protein B0H17DRAFT_1057568 [Mycena rosella]|uniref:Uncharacterized protein n=1 Tax=Mycena rosella TaxID=1033263 RepID=A0AAD7DLY8_MYCRO|nr:hypothetical protein B0H17DRAFT_1057568 [Mycena rosella]